MIKPEAILPYVPKSRLVYERLRDLILRGEIPAGARVPLGAYAKPLGVSNMPVRDALRQLEHDGLVVIRHHVGAVVTQVSVQDLEDTFSLREVLEGLAARLAVQRMTPQDETQIRDLLGALGASARRRPFYEEDFLRLNREFHVAVARASQSLHLLAALNGVWDRADRYLRMLRFVPDRAGVAQREHEAIASALAKKQAGRAEQLARAHIRRVVDDLRPHVRRMSESRDSGGGGEKPGRHGLSG